MPPDTCFWNTVCMPSDTRVFWNNVCMHSDTHVFFKITSVCPHAHVFSCISRKNAGDVEAPVSASSVSIAVSLLHSYVCMYLSELESQNYIVSRGNALSTFLLQMLTDITHSRAVKVLSRMLQFNFCDPVGFKVTTARLENGRTS